MKHQTVCGEAFGQKVVCDEAVEQVVLAMVVLIGNGIGIYALCGQVTNNVIYRYLERFLAQQGTPEAIGLGKEGVAIITVLGRIEVIDGASCRTDEDGQLSTQIGSLVGLVLILLQGVDQSYGLNQLGCHIESLAPLFNNIEEQLAQRVIGGADNSVGGMHHSIQQDDIAVALVQRCAADLDAAYDRVFLGVMNRKLAVVHIGRGNLGILAHGEVVGVVEYLVSPIDDAVIDDDLLHGIALVLAGKRVPRGAGNQPLGIQRVQESLNSIVCRRKNGIVASGREQLTQGGLARLAHRQQAQQPRVFAVLLVRIQIVHNGLFPEDVATRDINFFGAAEKGCKKQ